MLVWHQLQQGHGHRITNTHLTQYTQTSCELWNVYCSPIGLWIESISPCLVAATLIPFSFSTIFESNFCFFVISGEDAFLFVITFILGSHKINQTFEYFFFVWDEDIWAGPTWAPSNDIRFTLSECQMCAWVCIDQGHELLELYGDPIKMNCFIWYMLRQWGQGQ